MADHDELLARYNHFHNEESTTDLEDDLAQALRAALAAMEKLQHRHDFYAKDAGHWKRKYDALVAGSATPAEPLFKGTSGELLNYIRSNRHPWPYVVVYDG